MRCEIFGLLIWLKFLNADKLKPVSLNLSENQLEIYNCVEKCLSELETRVMFVFYQDGPYNLIEKISKLVTKNGYVENYSGLRGGNYVTNDVYYVTLIEKIDDLNDMMRLIFYAEYFNPERKSMVIYLGKDVEEACKVLGSYLIRNVIVLDKDGKIYLSKVFRQGCKDYEGFLVGNCGDFEGSEIIQLYQTTVEDFLGCDVKALALVNPPYVRGSSETNLSGIEVAMYVMIGTLVNFNLKLLTHNFTSWGMKRGLGNYSEMLGALFRNESDIVFGMLPMQRELLLGDFSGTTVGYVTELRLFLPKAKRIPIWKNILKVFNGQTWTYIVCTQSFLSVFVYFTYNIYKKFLNIKTINSFEFYKILYNVSIKIPKNDFSKLLYLIVGFLTFILTNSFSSCMISFLTMPIYETQINSLDKLLKSDLPLAGHPYHLNLIKWDPKFANKKFINCSFNDVCINRLVNQRDIALIHDSDVMKFRNVYDKEGRLKIFTLPNWKYQYYLSAVLRKGFPLVTTFNEYFTKLREIGIMHKFKNDFVPKFRPEDNFRRVFKITLPHLGLNFVVLLVGNCVASMVFGIELCTKLKPKKKEH